MGRLNIIKDNCQGSKTIVRQLRVLLIHDPKYKF